MRARGLIAGLAALAGALSQEAWAAHAYAQFGDIKYPAGFSHFEWANPDAPQGAETSTLVPPLRITNFDKYNPFTLKGTAPPGLTALVFETLLTGTMDEPTTAYGLLAEDVEVASGQAVGDLSPQPAGALSRRHAGDGSRRQAQLRHADEQAGGAAVPRGVRRRQAGGGDGSAQRALRFQDAPAPSCRCWSAGCRCSAAPGAPASPSTRWSRTCRSRAAPTASGG